MANRYIFSDSERPSNPNDFASVATGGTINGASGTVQLTFDDSVYGSGIEGKQRLVAAVKALADKLESAKVWPLTAAS